MPGTSYIPSMREFSAADYVGEDEIWMFGGLGSGPLGRFDVLCAFDMNTLKWRKVDGKVGQPPAARAKHTLCAFGKLLYVYGGEGGISGRLCTGDSRSQRVIFNETFCFNTETLEPTRAADSRCTTGKREFHLHGAVILTVIDNYADAGPAMLVFGGAGPEAIKARDRVLGDLWAPSFGSEKWRHVESTGTAPSPRWAHSFKVGRQGLLLWRYNRARLLQ